MFCTQQVDTQFTAAHENKIGPMAVAIFLRHNGGNVALKVHTKKWGGGRFVIVRNRI